MWKTSTVCVKEGEDISTTVQLFVFLGWMLEQRCVDLYRADQAGLKKRQTSD